jgi:DNA polymerase
MKKRLTMDFETRSRCNLNKAGAYKYSLDPSTQPTCLAYKFYGVDTIGFFNFQEINRPWHRFPMSFRTEWERVIRQGYEFSAHNAFFETCIYKNILVARYGWPDIPFEQFRCTLGKAAACALPRALEKAGAAMKLSTQKDKRGYAAMMKTCKPTKQFNDWHKKNAAIVNRAYDSQLTTRQQKWLLAHPVAPPEFLEPDAGPDVWEALYLYCKIDVKAEELLDRSLPDLTPKELEIWFLNQRLNWRGLPIDIKTVEKIVKIMGAESASALKELDKLTMGLVTKPGSRKSILEFLALEGIELPDIKAKTIDDALKDETITGDMHRLLEIRKALSKTSTKKYQGFLDRAMPDNRVRDILLYHGASTGRDTGTGIQPHNFPRLVMDVDKVKPYSAVQDIVEQPEEMLRILYGQSLAFLFSSVLRNMIVPSPGCDLFVADFSKIEVAVCWWLANNVPGLKILKSGKDPYIYQAAMNLGKSYEDIEAGIKNEEQWALDARQLGKAQILGCQFGMGWAKFQSTAYDQYRLRLSDDKSKAAVTNYREANPAVPLLWKTYENAAIQVVTNGQSALTYAGRCTFENHHKFLWAKLPSGRKLAYRDPLISMRETDWGPRKTLEFWGVNSKTKKWAIERTWGGTLTENIVQAVARDLMMPAMVRLEKRGYSALLMVHDEGLTEKRKGEGSIEEFTKIMCERPDWGDENLIVEAKGWKGPRYRK